MRFLVVLFFLIISFHYNFDRNTVCDFIDDLDVIAVTCRVLPQQSHNKSGGTDRFFCRS